MAKKKSSTRSRLIDRAQKGGRAKAVRSKEPSRRTVSRRPAQASAGSGSAGMALGGLEIPGLQLDNVQETVRTVVNYVQQNPLAAAAVAIGAGVMLTSMYWDSGSGGRRRR